MTVGQLISILQKYNEDTPVVMKSTGSRRHLEDYIDVDASKIQTMVGKPVFKDTTHVDRQVYDATEVIDGREVLSLTGVPLIQEK